MIVAKARPCSALSPVTCRSLPASTRGRGDCASERPVEVLINNAGGGRPYDLDAPLDAEAWDEAIGLNFTAHVVSPKGVARHAACALGTNHHDHRLACAQAMNAATPAKAAIASWSRALSYKSPPTASRSTASHPRINSEQVLNRLFPTEETAAANRVIPAGASESREIAAVITFLASARASTSPAR